MTKGMIWPFEDFEDKDGTAAEYYEVAFLGRKKWVFTNNPPKQRVCKCTNCGTAIPREVPRLKLVAAYYLGGGYWCLSCGIRQLKRIREVMRERKNALEKVEKKLEAIERLSTEVMLFEQYPKRMALARMIQVIKE